MGQNAEKIIFVASNTHKYVAKEGGCNLICRRAPHGARGLKPLSSHTPRTACSSRPARGAWIETVPALSGLRRLLRRAPHGARGLKRVWNGLNEEPCKSRPARGAWIETAYSSLRSLFGIVAPRTGRVD